MYEYWLRGYLNLSWQVQKGAESYKVYRWFAFDPEGDKDFNDLSQWTLVGDTEASRFFDASLHLTDVYDPYIVLEEKQEIWYKVTAVFQNQETLIHTERKYPRFAENELDEPEIISLTPLDNGIAIHIDPKNNKVPISHIELERIYRIHDPVGYPSSPNYSTVTVSRRFSSARQFRRIFDNEFQLPSILKPRGSGNSRREFYVQIGYRVSIVTIEGIKKTLDPFDDNTTTNKFLYLWPFETHPNVRWSMQNDGLIEISSSNLAFMWLAKESLRDTSWASTNFGTVESPIVDLFYTLPAVRYELLQIKDDGTWIKLANNSSPNFVVPIWDGWRTYDKDFRNYRVVPITYMGELVWQFYGSSLGPDPADTLPYFPATVELTPYIRTLSDIMSSFTLSVFARYSNDDLEIFLTPAFHPFFKKYYITINRYWEYPALGEYQALNHSDTIKIETRDSKVYIQGAKTWHLQQHGYIESLKRNPSKIEVQAWAEFHGYEQQSQKFIMGV